MTPTKPGPVRRLADLAARLDERREAVTRLRRALDNLERKGVVVAAERDVLTVLQHGLGQVPSLLAEVKGGDRRSVEVIGELEALLASGAWALADQIIPRLEQKEAEQEATLRACVR